MAKSKILSLRKSCEACAKAKRRCDAQLPQCSRCFNKALACAYVNDPLTAQDKSMIFCTSNAAASCEGGRAPQDLSHDLQFILCPFAHAPHLTQLTNELRLWSTQCLLYEPALANFPLQSDELTVQYLVTQLKEIPLVFARGRSTPFIHSQLYQDWLPRQIQDAFNICRSYSLTTERTANTTYGVLEGRLHSLVGNQQPDCSFKELLATV